VSRGAQTWSLDAAYEDPRTSKAPQANCSFYILLDGALRIHETLGEDDSECLRV